MAQSSDPSANQTDYPISLTWLGLTRGTGKDTFPRVPSGGFEPTTFVFAIWWLNRKATLPFNKVISNFVISEAINGDLIIGIIRKKRWDIEAFG